MSALYSVITALTFFFMPAQTILYSQELTPIVSLPTGYFVLQNSDSAPEGYIAVAYDDLTGYVRADSVQAVDYTPVTKFELTVRFRCNNDGQPVNLRAEPFRSAPILSVLAPTDSGRCYGTITGDTLISGAGAVWYYVNVNGTRGYCYSAHVDVDATPPNVIEKEQLPEPEQPANTEPQPTEEQQSVSWITALIFIIALCIPVPFIMFYLFRKPKASDE